MATIPLILRYWLTSIAFSIWLLQPCASAANDPLDLIDGPTLGDQVVAAVNQWAEYNNEKASLNEVYATARREFWRTYPDRPGHQEARQKFTQLLLQKDLYLGSLLGQAMQPLDDLAGGQLDGGIHPEARIYYERWTQKHWRELEKAAGVTSGNKQSIAQLFQDLNAMAAANARSTALSNSYNLYAVYKLARDKAEFKQAGKVYPGSDEPRQFFIQMLVLGQEFIRVTQEADLEPWSTAQKMYEEMAEAFGEEHLHRHAKLVMAAPKSPSGWITPETVAKMRPEIGPVIGEELAISPEQLTERCYGGSSKAYALEVIRDAGRPPLIEAKILAKYDKDLTPWRKRRAYYDAFVQRFGEQKVLAIIERLRLPDSTKPNYAESVGCFAKLHHRTTPYGDLKPHGFAMDCFEFLITHGAEAEQLVNRQVAVLDSNSTTAAPDGSRQGIMRRRGSARQAPASASPPPENQQATAPTSRVNPPPANVRGATQTPGATSAPVDAPTNVVPKVAISATATDHMPLSEVKSNAVPQLIEGAAKRGLNRLLQK